jgi:hypothetical protein
MLHHHGNAEVFVASCETDRTPHFREAKKTTLVLMSPDDAAISWSMPADVLRILKNDRDALSRAVNRDSERSPPRS